ncbi:MAG: PEP-CTERM sorting domain-containing protein [Myxococcota bacterium]
MRRFIRLILLSLLLATSLLVFGAASASAYAVTMTNDYNGLQPQIGDVITTTLTFDTEGAANVALLSVSVIFDETQFSYDFPDVGGALNPTYILYTPVGRGHNYLTEGTSTTRQLRFNTTNQLLVDFVNIDLPDGNVLPGVALIATIEFTVTAFTGAALFDVTADAPGNVLWLGHTGVEPLATSGDFTTVPEPTTALLMGLGLTGLAMSGRRQRS